MEEQEKARGVLLYLEERYEQVDDKIENFSSLLDKIQKVLAKFLDGFNTRLEKSMNVEPAQLKVVEGSKPYACFMCRPNPVHYREKADKLV